MSEVETMSAFSARLPSMRVQTRRGEFVLARPIRGRATRAWIARGEQRTESWVWVFSGRQAESVAVLERISAELPGVLLTWFETVEVGDFFLVFFEPPPTQAVHLNASSWRALSPQRAVSCLLSLTAVIEALHERGFGLFGAVREHLWFDPTHDRLVLAAAPRLATFTGDDVEEPWLDVRVFGELLFENTTRQPYPGDFDLASALSSAEAQQRGRLLEPGFVQVLAGCVTPHGDAAFRSIEALREGLRSVEQERAQPLLFHIGQTSTIGSYIFRKTNQDSCGHIAMRSNEGSRARSAAFCCVADGIGGLEDGERASGLAVRAACEGFARAWAHYGAQRMSEEPVFFARAIAKAVSQQLTLQGELFPEGNRGGTTFTGLLFADQRVGLVHVGDSRAFLLREGRMLQLSEDHNLGAILDRLREIAPELARSDRNPRTISRFMSTSHELSYDHIDTFSDALVQTLGAEAASKRHGLVLRRDDLFLLTSDGVHEELPERELVQICQRFYDDPQRLCDELVTRAVERIGKDNATALAVYVV